MDEVINSNTCGYIKIDKMFIDDIEKLYGEYLKVKDKMKKEIINELTESGRDKEEHCSRGTICEE